MWFIITLSLLAIGGIAYWWHSDNAFYSSFTTIAKGDSRQSVINKLGRGKSEDCVSLAWGGDDTKKANDGSCVSSLRYFRFMMMYVVGFDDEGRVISRYEGFSP
jgi:hypothetical protein